MGLHKHFLHGTHSKFITWLTLNQSVKQRASTCVHLPSQLSFSKQLFHSGKGQVGRFCKRGEKVSRQNIEIKDKVQMQNDH